MNAYKHLVRTALNDGNKISVWDGEEWQVRRGTNYDAIVDAIESVEEAQIRIRTEDDDLLVGWALIIPFGVDRDETVADHTDNAYMNSILSAI